MKLILFAIFLLILLSTFVFSQEVEKENKPVKIITACKVKLADAGKTANFQFSYRYLVDADENGHIAEVKQLHKEHPKFVNEEDFIPCIKTWRLRPSEKAYVHLFYGTTSEQFYISISSKEELIKILL